MSSAAIRVSLSLYVRADLTFPLCAQCFVRVAFNKGFKCFSIRTESRRIGLGSLENSLLRVLLSFYLNPALTRASSFLFGTKTLLFLGLGFAHGTPLVSVE